MSSTIFIDRTPRRAVHRRTLTLAVAVAALALGQARAAGAQQPALTAGRFELRPYTGAYIATGAQRDLLEDAVLVGAQASWRLSRVFAVTGTIGWAPSEDRLLSTNETLDLFQYDLGAEARLDKWVDRGAWTFTPFAGLGIGGRTYDYRDLDDVDSKSNFLGYGALGGELGFGRMGLRLEARDYVSGFKQLRGTGDSETRNDLTISAGLTLRF